MTNPFDKFDDEKPNPFDRFGSAQAVKAQQAPSLAEETAFKPYQDERGNWIKGEPNQMSDDMQGLGVTMLNGQFMGAGDEIVGAGRLYDVHLAGVVALDFANEADASQKILDDIDIAYLGTDGLTQASRVEQGLLNFHMIYSGIC